MYAMDMSSGCGLGVQVTNAGLGSEYGLETESRPVGCGCGLGMQVTDAETYNKGTSHQKMSYSSAREASIAVSLS